MEIKLPVILDGYQRKKDRSYSLKFITSQELGKDDRDSIDEAWQQEGWLVFAVNETQIDLPKERANVDNGKTPSQRLRGRMFVYWKEKKIETPFNVWYEAQLDKVGQRYLDNLETN